MPSPQELSLSERSPGFNGSRWAKPHWSNPDPCDWRGAKQVNMIASEDMSELCSCPRAEEFYWEANMCHCAGEKPLLGSRTSLNFCALEAWNLFKQKRARPYSQPVLCPAIAMSRWRTLGLRWETQLRSTAQLRTFRWKSGDHAIASRARIAKGPGSPVSQTTTKTKGTVVPQCHKSATMSSHPTWIETTTS